MNPIQLQTTHLKPRHRGFTLTEILVVIGIIVILLTILIPVIGRVRDASRVAAMQAQINALDGAVRQYGQDNGGALPGPLSYTQVRQAGTIPTADEVKLVGTGTVLNAKLTMSENLVLGLLGGLKLNATTGDVEFDPALVGTGAKSLNAASPKTFKTYLEKLNLSAGDYVDAAGGGDDSVVPEIVDVWPKPMPILYLRARKGVNVIPPYDEDNNPVITHNPGASDLRAGQYDTSQYIGYTMADATGYLGEEKDISESEYAKLPPRAHGLGDPGIANPPPVVLLASLDKADTLNYQYPYNAYPYFRDPKSSSTTPTARNKDGFILICAGKDRVYGTADDITNFGAVAP